MNERAKPVTLAVLGASGGVGRLLIARALARGYAVRGQTRDAQRLGDFAGRIAVAAFDPRDPAALEKFVAGADAVIFAVGIDNTSKTDLFSAATAALLAAMRRTGTMRLVAITGIGAGETRGHGGFFYDRVIFPLFTRHRYADKTKQEALIAASDRDWVIVRPAPFASHAPAEALQVHTTIPPGLKLRRVTRDEVAAFALEQVESDSYLRQKPFIGHP